MLQEVPKASVVITNHTHIATALRYNPQKGDKAPVVLAKGKGQIAERIVEVAMINSVPIVRKEPLARALEGVLKIPRYTQSVIINRNEG